MWRLCKRQPIQIEVFNSIAAETHASLPPSVCACQTVINRMHHRQLEIEFRIINIASEIALNSITKFIEMAIRCSHKVIGNGRQRQCAPHPVCSINLLMIGTRFAKWVVNKFFWNWQMAPKVW